MKQISKMVLQRRELLSETFRLALKAEMKESADKLPVKLYPRETEKSRCCIYREREIARYRILAAAGQTALFQFLREGYALKDLITQDEAQKDQSEILIVPEACDSCPEPHIAVTGLCRGCEARKCQAACPKDAITIEKGQVVIDREKCIQCGLCVTACPYHSLVKTVKPCAQACPVDALGENDDGEMFIDEERCILCGNCQKACPFGAVVARSQVLSVMRLLKKNSVAAIVAPSSAGQLPGSGEQLNSALKLLGFTDIYDAALGADMILENEADECVHMADSKEILFSSCCPAWKNYANKIEVPLKGRLSGSPSPMTALAQCLKEQNPDQPIVFIGPCLAKKKEAAECGFVDGVITFEELACLFMAADIDVRALPETQNKTSASNHARRFSSSGGVASAVSFKLSGTEIKSLNIDGITAKTARFLKNLNPEEAGFVEVMACEGGCVNGPGRVCPPKISVKKREEEIEGSI